MAIMNRNRLNATGGEKALNAKVVPPNQASVAVGSPVRLHVGSLHERSPARFDEGNGWCAVRAHARAWAVSQQCSAQGGVVVPGQGWGGGVGGSVAVNAVCACGDVAKRVKQCIRSYANLNGKRMLQQVENREKPWRELSACNGVSGGGVVEMAK